MVLVHGGQAFLLLPAGREDVVEGHGHDVQLVEAGGCRELGERVDEVVVHPPVAHLAAFDALLVGEHAALELELGGISFDAGAAVLVLRRQA